MTALKEYQRLECTGLWRDAADGQRREVIVSFGDATLVISETRSDRAITHWSLPATHRRNPGRRPAIYSPGPDAGEELEIDDEAMIAAISKVHRLIEARRPHPGRLRGILLGALLVAVLALGLVWMPQALIRHTAEALPFSKRQEIGRAALADLTRLTGPACASSEGRAALQRLRNQLVGASGDVIVLPEALGRTAHLPGGMILVARPLIETQDTPEPVAGAILAESQRLLADDPMIDVLDHAGLRATLALLTTGDLPASALEGYGERLLARAPAPVADQGLLKRFAAAGLPATPYAYMLDPSGESVIGLIEADPFRKIVPPGPILSDSDWVALQGICAN